MKAILTYTYSARSENRQVDQFYKSVERLKIPVFNCCTDKKFISNQDVMRKLLAKMHEIKHEYSHVCYIDGGDSFVLKDFEIPDNKMLYQAEKNCYPHPYMREKFTGKTVWKYLNGGGWCGPVELCIEYFETYLNPLLSRDENGQHLQMLSYFAAKEAGFPIELDENCEVFQSIAFPEGEVVLREDFRSTYSVEKMQYGYVSTKIYNKITETEPAIFHANGRTEASWVYDILNL